MMRNDLYDTDVVDGYAFDARELWKKMLRGTELWQGSKRPDVVGVARENVLKFLIFVFFYLFVLLPCDCM